MPFSDRLSAMDVLTIRKVKDYAYQKAYGEGRKVDKEGEKIDCKNCLEILCMHESGLYKTLMYSIPSLVPRPRLAFRRLQYGKVEEGLVAFLT